MLEFEKKTKEFINVKCTIEIFKPADVLRQDWRN